MEKIVKFRLKNLRATKLTINNTLTKRFYQSKIELLESILQEHKIK